MNQKSNMYDRLSFRSPLRRTSQINKPEKIELKVDNKVMPVPKPVLKMGPKTSKSKMYQRGSTCRSPKAKMIKPEETYKIVTKTPSGASVKVPELQKSKFSFVKFIEKKIPTPIQQEIVTEYIKINPHKKYHFDDALLIYENNQTFYLEQIEDNANLETVLKNIAILEQWFNMIKEPKPILEEDVEEWKERCEWKIKHGYSKYFNIELLTYTNYFKID